MASTRSDKMRAYGLTEDGYEYMLAMQGGVCAICEREPTEERRLAVDHDHANGTVRGLLCFRCNIALGHFGDDLTLMRKAVEYLETAYHCYADDCPQCDGLEDDAEPFEIPWRVEADGDGWVRAHYQCKRCRHRWTCGWAASIRGYGVS